MGKASRPVGEARPRTQFELGVPSDTPRKMQIHVYVTVEEKLWIERQAAKDGIPMSQLIIRYVKEGMERDKRAVH